MTSLLSDGPIVALVATTQPDNARAFYRDVLGLRLTAFERFSFMQQDEHGVSTAPGGAKIAWLKDPDANTLSLTQW